MDVDGLEGLDQIGPSVYRVAMKLQSLQNICHMDVVLLQHITAALNLGSTPMRECMLSKQEVTQNLKRMFCNTSVELSSHVMLEASEQICSLMFRMFDRNESGQIATLSLYVALLCLSAETLLLKYRGLVCAATNDSGSISRSSLRAVLEDVSQVPAVVQEEGMFGDVDEAIKSCFHGVLTHTVRREHVSSWLQSEPHLLLWLPVLFRLSVSQKVVHNVRCHICKTFPISGLRYRCMRCVNFHLCQSCFLSERHTRKHKSHHPVTEFCTQPTWQESLSYMARCAGHFLSPRRFSQRGTDRSRGLQGNQRSHLPPHWTNTTEECKSRTSNDSSVHPHSSSSISLQTEDMLIEQSEVSTLLAEVRDLNRDKRLLEEEMKVWRLAVQSEHSVLEERCTEMEITMEAVREHNCHLQVMLTHAQIKKEANYVPQQDKMETIEKMLTSSEADRGTDTDLKKEFLLKTDNQWSENEETISTNQKIPWSHDIHYEEAESAGERLLCQSVQQEIAKNVEPLQEDTCMVECESCDPEELLQETADRLRSFLWPCRRKDKQSGDEKGAELIEAANLVGDSLRCLVDTVRQVQPHTIDFMLN
ncbi:dystrotelin [Nerophis ophidion]|uniref:dystrotelin n=1 Tax=Nerophis ophidion TaxID=159077 RepID=UPI002AE0A264|nr:dystrotelin [Nerophis ophidion]